MGFTITSVDQWLYNGYTRVAQRLSGVYPTTQIFAIYPHITTCPAYQEKLNIL